MRDALRVPGCCHAIGEKGGVDYEDVGRRAEAEEHAGFGEFALACGAEAFCVACCVVSENVSICVGEGGLRAGLSWDGWKGLG